MARRRNEGARAKFAFYGACFLMRSRPKPPCLVQRECCVTAAGSPAVEERLELDRGARVAELLDEGEKLVELLRVAHGEAEQRVELTHHVIVADDGALRGAEIARICRTCPARAQRR